MVARRAFLILLLAAITAPTAGRAAEQVPVAPLRPTSADCNALWTTYTRIRQQARAEVSRCMSGPYDIRLGYEVSSDGRCALYRSMRAWPQCVREEQEACQIEEYTNDQFRVCNDRARVVSSDAARTTLNAANTGYEAATEAVTRYEQTIKFIESPGEFLGDLILGNARETAIQGLTPRGRPRPQGSDNEELVYRSVRNANQAVLDAGVNPVIQEIQQRTFGEIFRRVDETLAEWDDTQKLIGEITIRAPGSAPPAQPPSPNMFAARPDCSLLKDKAAKRYYKDSDPKGFRTLVDACD